MTDEQKKEVAVFRYGIIADLVGAIRLDRGEREALLREKCARKWQIPFSPRTRMSRSTIIRWVQKYNEGGRRLEALTPQDRTDQGQVRAIDEETGLALLELRRQLPKTTVPELIRILHQRQLVTGGRSVSQTTVYRFLHQHNLMAQESAPAIDRRKFEAELPNDLWQSDVMHGPHLLCGDKRRKSYLIAFIDDHSRLIPHARFYLSEALAPFMEAFQSALGKRGLPRKLYVDNGSAFRSRGLEHTTAALGIALIHAKPYQPQGKGKIERFFRTVRTQFLPEFSGQTLEQINAAFENWLEQTYHQRRHGSTGQSPSQGDSGNKNPHRSSGPYPLCHALGSDRPGYRGDWQRKIDRAALCHRWIPPLRVPYCLCHRLLGFNPGPLPPDPRRTGRRECRGLTSEHDPPD